MRLHQLFEQQSFNNFDEIFEYAVNACRPILQQSPSPLYRGMDTYNKHEDKIISSGKRVPSGEWDGDDKYRTFFDKWMVEKFGYKYLSQGIFATGDISHARDYGDLHIVLPIGPVQYVWSPIFPDQQYIQDAFLQDQSFGANITYELFSDYMEKSAKYTNKNLQQALNTDHEIILKCNSYFHFSESNLTEWNSGYTSIEQLWNDLRG